MAIKQEVGVLLAKKMDRKDFLRHVGVAVVAATGFGAVLRAMSGNDAAKGHAVVGYGSSVYGGIKHQG